MIKRNTTATKNFVRHTRNRLLDKLYWLRAKKNLQAQMQTLKSPADALNVLWQYQGDGFYRTMQPNQNLWEISELYARVRALQPRIIMEIGTRDGGTLFLWSRSSPDLKLLISVDLPGGIHGGGYPAAREKFYQLFVQHQPDCQLELLRRDSQQDATRKEVEDLLQGQKIDFLFIDGDHRDAGVRRDYALYADLVRPGGLIAFHDIYPNTHDPSIQVNQLWDDIREAEPQTEEIRHEPYTGRYGIGIVTKQS
ncbi:MAG: class I SAM-dependent methyltransferase [Aggregatilineales bacterium]